MKMTLDEARKRLFDTGFLLGGRRRRAALKVLLGSPGPEGVLALAAAIGQGHPHPKEILNGLGRLAAPADAAKIEALWDYFSRTPSPALAGVLNRLGWPPGRAVPAKTAQDLLALPEEKTPQEILNAVATLARALPVGDEAANDAIYGAWLRSGSKAFDWLIAEPGRRPGAQGVVTLAGVLSKPGHPRAAACTAIIQGLSPTAEAEKIAALWGHLARAPSPALAGVLTKLGWPPGRAVETKTRREVLALAVEDAAPEVLQAVAAFAHILPVDDEAANDDIYGAWVRSQSAALESLIAQQGRQSASPALEALHALVTGRLERYAALKDQDGALLVQAFAMAPEPFRSRLAQGVAASPDRGIKEAYRRALSSGEIDKAQSVANLKLVGDEDGLFEQTRHLRLLDVLGLCERWAAVPGRPTHPDHRAAVDKAVTEYRGLGAFKVEPGPELPDGMVDIFDVWRDEKPSDADLRADLTAEDPFRKARALYLGQERNLVEAQRLAAAAKSEHWPERLIARLLDPAALAGAPEDHVLWVNACAGDAGLLAAPIGGTPEDYARHSARFQQASGPAAARTRALLSILCTFQGVFVAGGITVDETGEATDRGAVELEDAGEVEFE
ncbi:hypothetical protein [uncultured Thiodictyon sp.]|jgi:hypothetical protein|uniref:hypothetical protein n=1 Tax=uncultured Thiodictyon sp. TaxID=1846217 RepID=UPI0025DC9037|nr:hypothetical protein [uncultured Thiodictyon sp.]